MSSQTRHTMGVVTQRTGLTGDVIRAWERRYGVVQPQRSSGGHRLYTDEDVERLRMLHRLTIGGRSISRIAPLSDEELAGLLREDDRAQATAPRRPVRTANGAAALLATELMQVRNLDAGGLDRTLRRAALALETTAFLDQVLGPLLHAVGDEWRRGEITPAHEHLASTICARVGGWLLDGFRASPGSPRFVACTPTGQHHELGALSAAVTAASGGWDVRYLGSDLPAPDIAVAAKEADALAVAISLVHPESDPSTAAEIEALGRLLPASVSLIVGGAASESYEAATATAKAVQLGSFEELRAFLERLAAA